MLRFVFNLSKRCFLYIPLTFMLYIMCFHYIPPAQAGQWYARIAAGIEDSRSSNFSDDDCSATSPPALYGCGSGSDGRALGTYGDFDSFASFDAALGRRVLPWLRTDISVSWRPNMVYSGQANFTGVKGAQPVYSSAEAFTAMFNFFADLIPSGDGPLSIFQPYIGAGLGLSYNKMDAMTFLFPGLKTHKISITPSGSSLDPAYTFSLGTGIVISDRISIDIAYRWSHLGRVETDAGRMYMNHVPQGMNIAGTSARLQTHGVQLGLRYTF
jgi:opacity protein-like surface antigen